MMKTLAKLDIKNLQPGWFWFSTFADYSIAEPPTLLGSIWHTLRGSRKKLFI